jgi:hypothetical protein
MTNEELLSRAEIDWQKEYWNLLGLSAKKLLQLEVRIKELEAQLKELKP